MFFPHVPHMWLIKYNFYLNYSTIIVFIQCIIEEDLKQKLIYILNIVARKSYPRQCRCVIWLIHDNKNANINFIYDDDEIKQKMKRNWIHIIGRMYKVHFAENNDACHLRLADAIAKHLIHGDLIEIAFASPSKKPRRAKEIIYGPYRVQNLCAAHCDV